MSEFDLDCDACGANIIKSYGEETKMRSKLLKWDRNGMYAVCKGCGHEIPIGVDLLKSIQSRFVYEVDFNSSKTKKNTL